MRVRELGPAADGLIGILQRGFRHGLEGSIPPPGSAPIGAVHGSVAIQFDVCESRGREGSRHAPHLHNRFPPTVLAVTRPPRSSRQVTQVVLHARSKERAAEAFKDLAPRAAGVVIGDLASATQTRSLADQVNKIGRMDAVIHNAGIFREPGRGQTPEGHARVLAVNVLAPYLLTGLIERPDRLVYLSSSMHYGRRRIAAGH